MLKINFLGELHFEDRGTDITAKVSKKGAAILAVLMLHRKRKVRRRELIGYLWPESSEDAAKYNLRYNLWQLKKIFHEDHNVPLFMISKEECWINNMCDYWCDICEIMDRNISAVEDVKELEKLWKLFRGEFLEDVFYPGCDDFEELVIRQRYVLEHKKMELLKQMIRIYELQKAWGKCLDALREYEELDPYDEDNALLKIRILMQSGSYQEARKFYHDFYVKLTFDIGVEPSDSLKKMAEKIRYRIPKQERDFSVRCECMREVPYYLMAELIGGLLDQGFSLSDYLTEERRQDLAYIQFRLGEYRDVPPPVRIINSFMDMIGNICSAGNVLRIRITNSGEADQLSADVLKKLEARYRGKLLIEWE